MATENLAPDVLLVQTGLSGTVADIDESPDSPDGNWLTTTAQNQTNTCRVSFPTPSGNLNTGSGLQTFRFWIRLSATNNAHGSATASIDLYENGSLVANLSTGVSYTNTTGQMLTATWDASLLSAISGVNVEARIVMLPEGGGPGGSRGCGEVGAVEWIADYSTGVFDLLTVTGSYSVTGSAADLDRGFALDAATGSYSISGVANAFPRGYILQTVTGSYSVAGSDADFLNAEVLTAESGSFSITGQDVDFVNHWVLPAQTGSYSVSGSDPTLDYFTPEIVLSPSANIAAGGEDTTAQLTAPTGKSTADFGGGRIADDENPSDAVDINLNEYREDEWSLVATAAATNLATYEFRVLIDGQPVDTTTVTPQWTISTGAYSLSAATGNYNYSGQAVSFVTVGTLQADTGSYAVTGQSASLNVQYESDFNTGSYAVTGQPVNFARGYVVPLVTGNYVYTGQNALVGKNYRLQTDAGAYAQSGQAAQFTVAYQIGCEIGSYSYVGANADLQTAGTLVTDAGNYAVTGQDVAFTVSYRMTTVAGAYSHTGQAADLDLARRFTVDFGVYSYTGQQAGLNTSPQLPVDVGSYTYTGQDALLSYSGGTVYTFQIPTGAYTLAYRDSETNPTFSVQADTGVYSYSGQDAELDGSFQIHLETGAYNLAGQNTIIATDGTLPVASGQYSVSGQNATLTYTDIHDRQILIV